MFESMKTVLAQWNQQTNDRQKLQQLYVVLVIIIVFVAGLISLFSGTVFDLLLTISLVLITTFAVNFVAWSLLKTTLLDKLPRTTPRATRRTAKR